MNQATQKEIANRKFNDMLRMMEEIRAKFGTSENEESFRNAYFAVKEVKNLVSEVSA